jgi:hypothetical protein
VSYKWKWMLLMVHEEFLNLFLLLNWNFVAFDQHVPKLTSTLDLVTNILLSAYLSSTLFFFAGTWGLWFLGRWSITWATSQHFHYFLNRLSQFFPEPALEDDSPAYSHHTAKIQGTYHHTQVVAWDGVSLGFPTPWLAWNCDPPDLHLSSKWDYRCELPHPVEFNLFI